MKPIFSALGLVAAGSLMYLVKNFISDNQTILEKETIKQILITLRKRFFSTLRQIAFVVNNIRANECDFEPKKISDIVMKDGGSGDAKLNLIEQLTIKSFDITRQSFQASCSFYKNSDYEIRLLLNNLSNDVKQALNGTVQSYNGPTMLKSSETVIHIYRQILKRRMQNIKQKIVNQTSNEDCIKRQFMIQEYLEMQGIKHEKQASEKVFISILQKNYRQDADFRIAFEHLEIEMTQFMEEIQTQQQLKLNQKANLKVDQKQKQKQKANQKMLSTNTSELSNQEGV